MKHLFLAFFLIYLTLLTSCGGGGGGSSTQSIANEAAKTAPWSDEPIVESISIEEKKEILNEIDSIFEYINYYAFDNQKKGDTKNINFEYEGTYGGKVIFKTTSTVDSNEGDDPFKARENGSYDFQGFEDSDISLHGKATYSLNYSQSGEFGEYTTVTATTDAGLSCLYNSIHYKVNMHWVTTYTYEDGFSNKEIVGTLNGDKVETED